MLIRCEESVDSFNICQKEHTNQKRESVQRLTDFYHALKPQQGRKFLLEDVKKGEQNSLSSYVAEAGSFF